MSESRLDLEVLTDGITGFSVWKLVILRADLQNWLMNDQLHQKVRALMHTLQARPEFPSLFTAVLRAIVTRIDAGLAGLIAGPFGDHRGLVIEFREKVSVTRTIVEPRPADCRIVRR